MESQMRLFLFVIQSLLILLVAQSAVASPVIAFVGDSITAGAVVNPRVKFETSSLWSVLKDHPPVEDLRLTLRQPEVWKTNYPMSKPKVLLSGPREYQGSAIWFGERLLELASWAFLNNPEYSWAHLMGRRLGYESENIIIAAENGAKSHHLVSQIARILKKNEMQAPEKLFVFYTGNDICSPFMQLITSNEVFRSNINEGLDYLFRHGVFNESSSYEIVLMGFVNVSQLYTSDKIMNKKVQAHGKSVTCEKLKDEPPTAWVMNQSWQEGSIWEGPMIFNFLPFPKNQASYCPSLFGAALDSQDDKDKSYRSLIANRVRDFRDTLKEISQARNRVLQNEKKTNITLRYLNDTSKISFEADEMAEDCFHLSARGQERIAQAVWSELQQSQAASTTN